VSPAAALGVALPGVDLAAATPVLRKFLVTYQSGATRWVDPPLDLRWGPYFEPSQGEIQSAVTWANTATNGQPVLSQRTAVQAIAPLVDAADDVAGELERIAAEATAAQAHQGDLIGKLGSAGDAPAPVAAGPEIFGYHIDAGVVTLNEVRARLGFGPVPDGDVPVAQYMLKFKAAEAAIDAKAKVVAAGGPAPELTYEDEAG
jgi:hypothetical protein